MALLNPAVRGECNFCGQEETVEHLFLHCKHLEGLFRLLTEWFRELGEDFSECVFIRSEKYKVSNKLILCLLNYVLGTA